MTKKIDIESWGVAAGGAGAALLATAATACCVPVLAPLIISVLGIGGAVWAAGLKPYSLYILAGPRSRRSWSISSSSSHPVRSREKEVTA